MDQIEFKKRVEAALMKNQKKNAGLKRPVANGNPEQKVVVALLKHLEKQGFHFDVVEASTFNKQAGYHTANNTSPGFSDLVGNSDEGLAMYIECKAPGKLNTLRPAQREFLLKKINSGCFAMVCDSVESFDNAWFNYNLSVDRRGYLISKLPKLSAIEKRRADSDLDFSE